MRDLELPRHGLQILPYEGGAVLTRDGGYLAIYRDHDANRREFARHSKRDAEAYDRYSRDVMRACRFIRPLLLRTPPDPTSLPAARPRRARLPRPPARRAHRDRDPRHGPLLDHEHLRLPRRIFRDPGDQGLPRGLRDHRHRARPDVAGLGLRAAAPLHGRRRRQRRRLGLRPRRHGRDHPGARRLARARPAAKSAPAHGVERILVRDGRATGVVLDGGEEIAAAPRRLQHGREAHLPRCVEAKDLPRAVPEARPRPSRPAAPPASSTSRSTACRASRRCPTARPA